jgi:predicted XRE-type DNA-binding protein
MKTPPTPAQIRETAQLIFPSEWREDPLTATMLALKLLAEAVADAQPLPRVTAPRSKLINELDRFLESCGLTQKEAAVRMGVHALSVSQWLQGDHIPRYDSQVKIRKFLATYRRGPVSDQSIISGEVRLPSGKQNNENENLH